MKMYKLLAYEGAEKAQRLSAQVGQVQAECEKQRHAREYSETERGLCRNVPCANVRANLNFENVDIPELEMGSYGPACTLG